MAYRLRGAENRCWLRGRCLKLRRGVASGQSCSMVGALIVGDTLLVDRVYATGIQAGRGILHMSRAFFDEAIGLKGASLSAEASRATRSRAIRFAAVLKAWRTPHRVLLSRAVTGAPSVRPKRSTKTREHLVSSVRRSWMKG